MNFVVQLAIILMAAGLLTIVARALKQPLILGYIVAGFLIGPNLGLINGISTEDVDQWSELGIIFLLFSLGLEFSFKKLISVGSAALITAGIKCLGMFGVGLLVGSAMRWSVMECIFLGGLLSMSSTTIIIKAYDDMKLKNRPHATLLFGSLVFEDLIAVLLMVLLSTLAVSNQFDGGQLVGALLKLLVSLILWFVVGIYLIPTVLRWAHRYINNEIVLIVAIGLCFAMVSISEFVGFSSALGAFVMGSILAETIESERIEHSISSIKDLFGAIFFVSVGMMVDPVVIANHWGSILILTVAAMGGILVFSTLGALLSGENLKDAVHVGFSLAQLGEFAFIIAGLGCSLGVMSSHIYPIVIAISVITTFTTPYMIKAADPVADWLYRVLPERWVLFFSHKHNTHDLSTPKLLWSQLLSKIGLRSLIYSALMITSLVFAKLRLNPLAHKILPDVSQGALGWIVAFVTLFVMLFFIAGFLYTPRSYRNLYHQLSVCNKSNVMLLFSLTIIRLSIAFFFAFLPFLFFTQFSLYSIIVMVCLLAVVALLLRRSSSHVTDFETSFVANLNAKEDEQRATKVITYSVQDKLSDYDVHVESVPISPEFLYIGKPLRQAPFRHLSGVNIIEIVRGNSLIRIPRGDEIIYPGDTLVAVGTTDQLNNFKDVIAHNTRTDVEKPDEFAVEKLVVSPQSVLAGKTLRESNLRQLGCLVVCVMHGSDLITNPSADTLISVDDTVWIAGEKQYCRAFL